MQFKFQKEVLSFIEVAEQMSNISHATRHKLIVLDTHIVMKNSVATSISQICEAGQTLHAAYVNERLDKASVPVSATSSGITC